MFSNIKILRISFFIMILSTINANQNPIYVKLKPDSKRKSVTLRYSVDSVIDNRLNNDDFIGALGRGKRKTFVLVKNSLASSINNYIQKSYTFKPILESSYTFKVNLINCSSRENFIFMIAELKYEFEFIDNRTKKTIFVKNTTLNCPRLLIYGSTYAFLIKKALRDFLNDINEILTPARRHL